MWVILGHSVVLAKKSGQHVPGQELNVKWQGKLMFLLWIVPALHYIYVTGLMCCDGRSALVLCRAQVGVCV